MMGRHKNIWHMQGESCCCCAMEPLSLPLDEEISGNSSSNAYSVRGRKNFKRSWRTLFLQSMVVVVLLAAEWITVGGSEDWTLLCPKGCKCTWVSGKKTADCRASHFTSIPTGLSPEVQVLEMGSSTIKMLPKDAFKSVGLVNLQKVFLQNSKIERIDRAAFRDLEIMIELDLSGNLLTSLDMETFESNIRLRELKLSNNPLNKLTGTSFPPLGYLKLLDLSECQLSSIPSKKAFQNLNVLETLSLSGNRFTYLSEELFRPLVKLKALLLNNNPWRCDCRLKSIRDWVISKNLFQHHTKCAEPAHVANFAWDGLYSNDFACRPEVVSIHINGKTTDASLVHTDLGSDIELQCLVRGNPPPELKWVNDGQVLTNTSGSRSYGKSYYLHIGHEWNLGDDDDDYRGRWVNLTIQKTEPEDAGEYTCVGSNAGGVVEKNLTLNFQDVPSIEVGHGFGGLGGGSGRESGLIWIISILISLIVFIIILVSFLVCFCSRRRRVKTTRAQDIKGDGRDDLPQRQLLLTPTSRSEGSDKIDEDGTTMLIMKEKYLVGPDARSQSADILSYSAETDSLNRHRPSSAQPLVPPVPSTALTGSPHGNHQSSEYPDLLDLPHTRYQDSPAPSTVSTIPDSTRMLITPQQLNPALLVTNPSRLSYHQQQYPIYSTGRPVSPYGVTFSPSEPAVLPATRTGYVTLPRRHRVPSWSPGPSTNEMDPSMRMCPSPTGSAATISLPYSKPKIKYDNLGPRTTADGSSNSRLNLDSPSARSTPQPLLTGTLGRHNVLRSTPISSMVGQPHFAPIQEVEPLYSPESESRGFESPSYEYGLPTPPSNSVGNGPTTTKTDPSSSGPNSDGPTKPKPPPNPKPVKKKIPPEPNQKPQPKTVNNEIETANIKSEEPQPSTETTVTTTGDDGTEV